MTTSRTCEFFGSAPARGCKRGHVGTLSAWKMICATLLLCTGTAIAANPVPFVNQPLVPDAAAPGGSGFTLTVNGTGFVASSVVLWNGSPRATHFVSQAQLTATVLAADIAKAGTASVTVVSPGPGGGTSDVLFFPVAEPAPSVNFSRTDFSSPGGNIQVATADFNGDGKLDLATAGYYDSTVLIFLGNGDGTFTAGPTYSACGAHALAAGDFDGDGTKDLAAGSFDCDDVTILLGNGNGTFTEGGTLAIAPVVPYRVAVGDFNGDGKLDLVTGDFSNLVSVLLGNGDGTFQNHVDYNVGSPSDGVAIGDFNRDGHLDLAVTGSESVSVLLGNGDGTFGPASLYQLPAGTPGQCDGYFGSHTPNIIAADLNGDGELDLVVPNTTGFVSVLLGNGDGTFHDGGSYNAGSCSADVTAADFNGDGTLDLAITNYASSSISLLLGNGDGTFQAPVDFGAGSGARGIAVGDFNGDGRLDLAVGNQFVNTISIFLNLPPGSAVTFTPSSLTFAPQPVGTFSQSQPVTLTNTGGETLTFSSINWATGDFYQSNNCRHTLAPQASCTLSVMFTPTAAGTRSGGVSVWDNAVGSPQGLPLTGTGSGTGRINLTLSPATLDFGSVTVGGTSNPQTVTVTNLGSVAASFVAPFGFNTAGADCSDFQINSQCGTSLAPNASCQVTVTFQPKAIGTRTGSFLALQGARTVSIPMSGTGTQ
jgi:FG-GAP-like repeat/HYDIN/CFA65/VesB-like, Ig-like domain/Abnormal spindle-like microcephaly-assoc'd, ASPM-SPD-2-Hydin/FG-GAP repeat